MQTEENQPAFLAETQMSLPAMTDLWQQTLNWQPDTTQQALFQQLYACILEGNQRLNLTRITQPEEFWEKHLWDSLRGIQPFLEGAEGKRQEAEEQPSPTHTPHSYKVIDIGTGAGFPGIPVAIVRPDWFVTLLDSTRKKIDFINIVLESLNLRQARTLVGRVETIGQQAKHREVYNLALIRAVAAAAICAEYVLPLLQVGGLAILYRGQWTDEESRSLEKAVKQLGGSIDRVDSFTTPLTTGERHCIHLRKVKPIPKQYPRGVGIPAQRPLG